MPARGLRNNNPGNIRHSTDQWYGASAKQTDPDFVQFSDMRWGLRAVARNLRTYGKRKAGDGSPVDTLAEVITRWAPPKENDTAGYIRFVAKATGLKPDDNIDLTDTATLRMMTKAIIRKETSQKVHDNDIADAVMLSNINTP